MRLFKDTVLERLAVDLHDDGLLEVSISDELLFEAKVGNRAEAIHAIHKGFDEIATALTQQLTEETS